MTHYYYKVDEHDDEEEDLYTTTKDIYLWTISPIIIQRWTIMINYDEEEDSHIYDDGAHNKRH